MAIMTYETRHGWIVNTDASMCEEYEVAGRGGAAFDGIMKCILIEGRPQKRSGHQQAMR